MTTPVHDPAAVRRATGWILVVTVIFFAVRGFGRGRGAVKRRRQQGAHPALQERLSLSILGPTTLHLRHELSLLVCMMILTSAALVSPYRSAFGTDGDARYLVLTGLWLSRHVLLRWLCPNDTSTSAHPTILGTAAKILSKCCSAGQYFDTPPPAVMDQHHGQAASDGGFGGEGAILIKAWLRQFRSILAGLLHIVSGLFEQIRLISSELFSRYSSGGGRAANPQGDDDISTSGRSAGGSGHGGHRRKGSSNSSIGDKFADLDATSPSTLSPLASFRASVRKFMRNSEYIRRLELYREKYIPPAQKCVFWGAILGILFVMFYFHSADKAAAAVGGPTAGFPGGGGSFHTNGMTGQNVQANNANQPRSPNNNNNQQDQLGGFGSLFAPPGGRHRSGGPFGKDPPTMMQILFRMGWMSTVVGLVVFGRLLLPVPDLAAGASAQKAMRMESRHYGGGGGGKPSKYKHTDALPWAEQYHSITSENRFRLHCRVIFLRIIENIMICTLAPQTEFACVATGHCEPSPNIWDLPGYLGVASSRNKVGGFPTTMYDDVIHDRTTSIILAFTVALVTAALLISQVATLDRSYLAITGFLSGESNARSEGGGRRHRDRRANPDLYNMLDGKSRDVYSKVMWKIFQGELGHPSTSRVLSMASSGLLGYLGLIFFVCIVYWVVGKDKAALVLAMVAVWSATKSVVTIGMLDVHGELDNLAKEIAAPLEARDAPHEDDTSEPSSGFTIES